MGLGLSQIVHLLVETYYLSFTLELVLHFTLSRPPSHYLQSFKLLSKHLRA